MSRESPLLTFSQPTCHAQKHVVLSSEVSTSTLPQPLFFNVTLLFDGSILLLYIYGHDSFVFEQGMFRPIFNRKTNVFADPPLYPPPPPPGASTHEINWKGTEKNGRKYPV